MTLGGALRAEHCDINAAMLPLMKELAAQHVPSGRLSNAHLYPGGGNAMLHDRMDQIEEKLDKLLGSS